MRAADASSRVGLDFHVLQGRLDFVAAIVGEALSALVQLVDCLLPGFSLRFSAARKAASTSLGVLALGSVKT